MVEYKERREHSFRKETINNLEELFNVSNPEEMVENPKEFIQTCRRKENYWHELKDFLIMYARWKDVKIEGEPIKEHDFIWQQGNFYKTNFWKKRSKQVKERDNWTCQKCGDGKNQLEAHHIEKRLDFDEPERSVERVAHEMENLVTLCQECHIEMEKLSPGKQKEILDWQH